MITIAHQRLAAQLLAPSTATTIADVVTHMGAMQAQDFLGATWALGVRAPNTNAKDVERALARRSIVRTWPMRGTLHWVAAADVRWMLELMTPRIVAGSKTRREQVQLFDADLQKAEDIIRSTLRGGKQLTRAELLASLQAHGQTTANQRGYHILWFAAQSGLICLGPMQGKQQTFVLLDEWLPPTPELTKAQALAAIAKRYFTSHGPATVHDFAWWTGLTLGDAKAGLAAVQDMLTAQEANGKTHWLTKHLAMSDSTQRRLLLLPPFDEYLLGYKDRSDALHVDHAQHIVPGNNGVFAPIIVLDGQVVGTWRRTATPKKVTVTAHFFAVQPPHVHQLFAKQAKVYATFLGLQLELNN